VQQSTKPTLQVLIRDRVEADPQFLADLVSDPHRAIAEMLGVHVPTSVEIVLHEQSPAEINLVLPFRAPRMVGGELSEEQLSAVGGGGGGGDWVFDADGTFAGGQFAL